SKSQEVTLSPAASSTVISAVWCLRPATRLPTQATTIEESLSSGRVNTTWSKLGWPGILWTNPFWPPSLISSISKRTPSPSHLVQLPRLPKPSILTWNLRPRAVSDISSPPVRHQARALAVDQQLCPQPVSDALVEPAREVLVITGGALARRRCGRRGRGGALLLGTLAGAAAVFGSCG